MKSKKSFYNISLIKSDILRFWPVWTLLLLFTTLTETLVTLSNMNYASGVNFDSYRRKQEYIASSMSEGTPLVFIFIIAPIVAVCVFSYMNKTQTSYTLHSLPITRSRMFFSHLISAFLIIAVPYTISFVAIGIINIAYGLGMGLNILLFVLEIYVIIAFYLSIASFVCMLSGNSIISLLIYYVINTLIYFVLEFYYLMYSVVSVNYNTGYFLESPVVRILTPVYYMYKKISGLEAYYLWDYSVDGEYKSIFDMKEMTTYNVSVLGHLALFIIPAVLFIFLAITLYKKRKLETVGDTLCFNWSKLAFRTVFTFFVGIVLTAIIVSVFDGMSDNKKYMENIVGIGIALVICTLISYIVCDMILEKTFFVWKKLNPIHMIIMVGCSLILLYAIGRIPNTPCVKNVDNVDYVQVYYSGNTYQYEGDNLDDSIIDFERELIKNNKEALSSYSIDELYEECDIININYYTKNGEKKNRYYYIDPNSDSMNNIEEYLNNTDYCLEALGLIPENAENVYSMGLYIYENRIRTGETSLDRKEKSVFAALISDIEKGNIKVARMSDSFGTGKYYRIRIIFYSMKEGSRYSSARSVYIFFDSDATNLMSVL